MKALDVSSLKVTPGEQPRTPTTSDRKRFRLTGPSRVYDKRIHAVRKDIADVALADWRFAPHYAQAEIQAVSIASTMMCSAARPDAEATSQLLHGEAFAVLDIMGDWAWGYSVHDHYVGYVRAAALGGVHEASHIVSVREAPVFAAASIKASVVRTLTLGARITGSADGDFVALADGYIHRRHIVEALAPITDPVDIATHLLGAPYLWGGRGAGGIDCSGLVQLSLGLAGLPCPRDSDQQLAMPGEDLVEDASLRRGDLVFFPGHVGLMVDEARLIHANAFWMAVTIEPLVDVVARLRATEEKPVTARRRLKS